jgi:hypothetical protein
MPLCPQITNTPITVTQTADFTVSSVLPVVPATTTQLDEVIVLADGKTKAFYQATAPTVGVSEGDIWFDTDDGNKQYYYNGTAWVSVQDTAIAAATSAAAAATAASAAAAAAAVAAQTTADGKNKIYRQTTMPTTGPFSEGDLWFDTDDDNRFYRYTSGAFSAFSLGNNAIASLSATKLTAGTIDASVITVSNINAGNISTGTLAADRILAASITGAKIAANTITAANITAGTITATEIAAGTITAAKIAAGTITATEIAAGTITAAKIATGTITATQIAAGTITTDKLTAGTLTGFTVQTSSGTNAVILQGSSNALSFKVSGTVVGNIVPLSSFGVLTHYGATPDPTGGTFPQMFVGSTGASIFASSSIGIGVNTSGIQLNAASSSINLNNQTNYPGIATASGSTVVVVTTGSRLGFVSSSRKTKKNIEPLTGNFVSKLLSLEPVSFDWKDQPEDMPYRRNYGLIAEDVASLSNEMESIVNYNQDNEAVSISYDRLTVFLMLAIKELKAEIDQLKGE